MEFLHASSTRAESKFLGVPQLTFSHHFVTQSASISLDPTLTTRTSGLRALTLDDSDAGGCGLSRNKVSASVTFSGPQYQRMQISRASALASAATISASPLVSAIVDCFLLVAVTGCQACLPQIHLRCPTHAVLSESLAQSESLNANAEPSHAHFAASNPNCNDSTDITPGLLFSGG